MEEERQWGPDSHVGMFAAIYYHVLHPAHGRNPGERRNYALRLLDLLAADVLSDDEYLAFLDISSVPRHAERRY